MDGDTEGMPKTKKRSPNWSEEEKSALSRAYNQHAKVLTAKISSTVTATKKKQLWSQIADEVSSVMYPRSVEEVKEKITKLKSVARGKAAEARKQQTETGGGPYNSSLELSPQEEALLGGMPSASYEGITQQKGVDTVFPEASNEVMIVAEDAEVS